MLGRAVRAGHAFTSAMQLVAQESPEPVAGEFSISFEEQNYGIPLRDALEHLADRMPLFDVRFLITALIVQKDSGGNLAEILDQLSRVIRERFRIRRDVKTKTAMGRLTAGILITLPAAMLAMMMFVNPEYESVLFHDPMGPDDPGRCSGHAVGRRDTSLANRDTSRSRKEPREMLFVAFIIFLVTICILMVLVYASGPQTVDIGRRLSRTLKPRASTPRKIRLAQAGAAQRTFLSPSGKCCPRQKGKKLPRTRFS